MTLDHYGSTAGTYAGWDRFGRIVDQKWRTEDGTVRDQFQHGYDAAGNRLWRDVGPDMATPPTGKDEFYAYDGLNRLTDARRGTLNEGKTALTTTGFRQNWDLDSVGNWGGFKEDTAGDGTTWTLAQARSHNKANEIDTNDDHSDGPSDDAITEGQGQTAWVSPKHDAAGNMTSGPKPGAETTRQRCVYDAWNRLAKVTDNSDVTVAEYRYDGTGHRIRKYTDRGGGVRNVGDIEVHVGQEQPGFQRLHLRGRIAPPLADRRLGTVSHAAHPLLTQQGQSLSRAVETGHVCRGCDENVAMARRGPRPGNTCRPDLRRPVIPVETESLSGIPRQTAHRQCITTSARTQLNLPCFRPARRTNRRWRAGRWKRPGRARSAPGETAGSMSAAGSLAHRAMGRTCPPRRPVQRTRTTAWDR